MKFLFDKDTSIISIIITVGLMLVFSVFQVHGQGQSYNKVKSRKIQSMYEKYNTILKLKSPVSKVDSVKNNSNNNNTIYIKKIKKAVTSLLISKRQENKDVYLNRTICYQRFANHSKFENYEKVS